MPCPICNAETIRKFRPFCSVECANRDLHNWLHEEYSLEGGAIVETDENAGVEIAHNHLKSGD